MVVESGMTAEVFWDMPEVPGKRIELVKGCVVEKPPMGVLGATAKANLMRAIGDFNDERNLGVVLPGVGCVIRRNPDTVRAPDVSFIARASVPADYPLDCFWEGPPTLAVEVVSPHDRADDTHERVQDFLESGTQQVWVLWPRRQSVSVYSPNGDTRELGPDAQLDGGDMLPGFSVTVSDLFEVRRRR